MKNRQPTAMLRMSTAILVLLMSLTAFAADNDPLGYALLIQQSPADGGTVSPGAGVHKISIGQSVQLVATPRQGYKFMYWLGDVSDTVTSETTINLDSPKLVVAVFEREDFEEELIGAGPVEGAGGGSGLRYSPSPIFGAGSVSPAVANYRRQNFTFPDVPDYEFFDDDFPVPGEGDFPVAGDETGESTNVPEPATLSLLGLGVMALLRKRK